MNEYTKGLEKIGQGLFTKCYAESDSSVILVSTDTIKECCSLWGPETWEPNDLFLPIDRLDYLETGKNVFRQKLVKTGRDVKMCDLKPEHADLLRWLRKNIGYCPQNRYDGYVTLYRLFESIPEQFEQYKHQLIEMLDVVSNTGADFWVELTPRNLARIDDNLILLDVFFNVGDVLKKRIGR